MSAGCGRLMAVVYGALVLLASPLAAAQEVPNDWDGTPPQALGHKDLIPVGPAMRTPSEQDIWKARSQAPLAIGGPGPIVDREVLGYLPYWEMDYEFQRWDLITTLAWFAAGIDADGDVVDLNGWGGAATELLTQEAHANGVVVIVTVTNFDSGQIAALLSSPTARANAIQSCLDLMAVHQADGVNIDFEFVPSSVKSEFVTFMSDLKLAVLAAQPNGWEGHVSLAGPAIDWSGAYDYDALLEGTDGIMVMAYGYHWGGGNPGPISPLYGGSPWGEKSIAWTIDDYITYGGAQNVGKVMMGLPFYGREWPVASTAVPGTALANGGAIFFRDAHPEALSIGTTWEPVSHTPYYHVTRSGQLYQVWYDDGASLEDKVDYIDQMGLGGIGIWALGYDGDYPDYWDAIEAVLVPDTVEPDAGPEPGPEPVPEVAEEITVEPGPEPQPEVVEEAPGPDAVAEPVGPEVSPEPEEDLAGPDAAAEPFGPDAGGGVTVGPSVTSTHTNFLAASPQTADGCSAGAGGSGLPWLAALLLVVLAVVRGSRVTRRSA